jgi:hypothetical protein
VFLVAALDGNHGVAIDLLERPDLRYESHPLGDRLLLGELALTLAPGKGDAARELIGIGRLRRRSEPPAGELLLLRHVEAPTPLERAFLGTHLAPGETLLAWLGSTTRLPIHSDILGDTEGELRFFVTDRRHQLIALSEVGDVREVPLTQTPRVEKHFGKAKISADDEQWQSSLGNADEYAEAAKLLEQEGIARLREAARLNFFARTGEHKWLASARSLLEVGRARGDVLSTWAAILVRADRGVEGLPPDHVELEAALSALSRARLGEDALGQLWETWRLGSTTARRVLEPLLGFGARAEPWAYGLHVKLHANPDATERGPFDRARADIALAEHQLATGRAKLARDLLERRLGEMPSEAVEELLPPSDADLTRGAGGQSLTIRMHELLARARGEAEQPDARALAVLARLQPLVLARLRSLSDAAKGDLAERTERTIRMLEPRGLNADGAGALQDSEISELGRFSIEQLLCHPLVREGGALLGRLQALLAAVPAPDSGVLRDYCESLALERHPDAASALRDAGRAFGVPDVHAYVSRGNKSVGLRVYEGTPPFVLIGVRHLEGDPEFTMTRAELRYAIGAEVAHLRYGHARVTSSEVWAGALSKSKQGLDFALGVLPILKGWRFADKVSHVFTRIPLAAARRVLDGAGSFSGRVRSGLMIVPSPRPINDGVLSRINEELVAAHRVMQLTADRAGLLLAGDLRSAVRGLLLLRRDHRQLLIEAEREGLDTLLARRDPGGSIEHQDLAIRVGALIAFYLSDDYEKLRGELTRVRPA